MNPFSTEQISTYLWNEVIPKSQMEYVLKHNEYARADLDMDKTFCICNYVPDWHGESPMKLVRKTFKNLYTFYP